MIILLGKMKDLVEVILNKSGIVSVDPLPQIIHSTGLKSFNLFFLNTLATGMKVQYIEYSQ